MKTFVFDKNNHDEMAGVLVNKELDRPTVEMFTVTTYCWDCLNCDCRNDFDEQKDTVTCLEFGYTFNYEGYP